MKLKRVTLFATLLLLSAGQVGADTTNNHDVAVDPACREVARFRFNWWQQTDRLLDALYDLRITEGKSASDALNEIAGFGANYDNEKITTNDPVTKHILVKLGFLHNALMAKKGFNHASAKCSIQDGLKRYRHVGEHRRLSIPTKNPLLGNWKWVLGSNKGIVEQYAFRAGGLRTTQSGDLFAESRYSLFAIGDKADNRYLLLDTGTKREGTGYFNYKNIPVGEITTMLFIRMINEDAYMACEDMKESICYGAAYRIQEKTESKF